MALPCPIWQFMNQTRQGMKMEHAPGGNPAMHPGMQPGMQPAGMAGQVCSQHFRTFNGVCIRLPLKITSIKLPFIDKHSKH